jgi:hypothetical protein
MNEEERRLESLRIVLSLGKAQTATELVSEAAIVALYLRGFSVNETYTVAAFVGKRVE